MERLDLSENGLATLVEAFYARVRADAELGRKPAQGELLPGLESAGHQRLPDHRVRAVAESCRLDAIEIATRALANHIGLRGPQ